MLGRVGVAERDSREDDQASAGTVRPGAPAAEPAARRSRGSHARHLLRLLREHRLFVLLLACGAVLRVLAWAAYRPALAFYSDSYEYLQAAEQLQPPLTRPLAYPVVLRAVSLVGPVDLVPALQHLLGLATAAGLYALLLRRSCRRWVAALAAAPLLLDAYQIDIEQFLLSETVFSALLLSLLALVLWRPLPSVRACAALGLLTAAAALTRTVALPLGALVLVVLVVQRDCADDAPSPRCSRPARPRRSSGAGLRRARRPQPAP